MRILVAIHLAGNALLLWLGYYWLGIGESRGTALAWSALVALTGLLLACHLHGATLAYFAMDKRRLSSAFRTVTRRLALLTTAVLGLLVIYLLLAQWAVYSAKPAFRIASWLTLTFRRPVKPAAVQSVLDGGLWLVRWVAVPVIALPLLSGIVTGRRRGRSLLYWVEVPILLVCGLWLPLKLIAWVPQVSGFGLQMFSLAVRLAIAYLLFVAEWLALEFITSGGRPRVTQPSTAASP
ncbi:MAG TPA: hypothetical protein VMI94_01175 [Bryobacteraceae bacterium]|nr:hypothetical protein [Bryobacteraceae bacterium]